MSKHIINPNVITTTHPLKSLTENSDLGLGESRGFSRLNGNFQSVRSSAGNLRTYYTSQTPENQSNRDSGYKGQYSSTPYSGHTRETQSKIAPTNKLSTKELSDEDPMNAYESFDESMMSIGFGEYEDGPSIRAETVKRGLDFRNTKEVLNGDLDAFMDRQLQTVAEKLADKKSLEKYNMILRMGMKGHMDNIQEMLDDSNDIQSRIEKERKVQEGLIAECEDVEFELNETRFRVQEILKRHQQVMRDSENLKIKLFNDLSAARDEFVVKRDLDEEYIEGQIQKIDKLDAAFRYVIK